MHFRHSFPSGTAFGSLKSESSPPLQVPISKVDVRAQCITEKWDLNRAVMFHDSMNRYSRMGIKQKFQMILNRNVNSLNWFSIHLIHQINQQYTKMNESWRLESPNPGPFKHLHPRYPSLICRRREEGENGEIILSPGMTDRKSRRTLPTSHIQFCRTK